MNFSEIRKIKIDRMHARRGLLTADILTAIAVLAVIMFVFSTSLNAFSRFNSFQLKRINCIAAAQAQLDSLTATGKTIDANDIKRLWPGIATNVVISDGSGDWQNTKLAKVTAIHTSPKPVKVVLARYIRRP